MWSKLLGGRVKRTIKAGFHLMGLEVSRLPRSGQGSRQSQVARENPLAGVKIQPWFQDDHVVAFLRQGRGRSALTPEALYILIELLDYAADLPGNAAEFGVWRGGSAVLLAKRLEQRAPDKVLHLLDTFQGCPETDPSKDNYYRKGDFADTSLAEVQEFLKDVSAQIKFHVGLFQETVHEMADEIFCFAHVDCDIYSSVMYATEFVYPRMAVGGVIVYDDYGWEDCAGARLAVDEFYADKSAHPIYLPTSQCIIIKR